MKNLPLEGGYPPGGEEEVSGSFGAKTLSKTPFGGDSGAMLGAKLGVKILLFC